MLRLPVEMTKSRTGRHAARKIVVIVPPEGKARIISKPDIRDRGVATYARGWAGWANVEGGSYTVLFRLVRGPSGRVSGEVTVYGPQGDPLLEMVLRRRKLRRRRGRRDLGWVIEEALKAIGLDSHVRRINLRTGSPQQ